MSEIDSSTLAKKVRGAKVNADGFPKLGGLATELGKMTTASIGEALDCPSQATIGSTRIVQIRDALDKAPSQGSYSWINDQDDNDAMFVILDNGFVGMITERMLGGPLSAPEKVEALSRVDAEISFQLVDVLMEGVNGVVQKATGPADEFMLGARRSFQSPEEAVGERENLALYEVSIDLQIGEHRRLGAIRYCFLIEYVERAGFLTLRTAPPAAAEYSPWRNKLSKNVKNLSVDVEIVLARYLDDVGNLSSLSVGQVIPIEEEALQALDLVVATQEAKPVIARGRLGAFKSQKAVKLTTDIDPEFIPAF